MKKKDKEEKYIDIWLTKDEAADINVRNRLSALYAECKTKKTKVVVFESGNGSLLENTKNLIRHAIEVEAQKETKM